MKKNSYFTTLILSLTIISVAAADETCIWPTKLTPELTSKFCDYRAGHFHSGLDIRTGGRVGVPVYAVADGYVWRVSMSFRGYGKALYLKLRDNRIVVYGHLSDFYDLLSERVRNAQFHEKKYSQDLYFSLGEFPVRKGQLVALSGSTGTGAPHLHFELRSSQNNPINPLNSGFAIADRNAPKFDYLAVRHYSRETHADAIPGDPCDIEFISVTKSVRPNEYTVKDTLISDGYLALAVSGGDLISGPGFLYSYYGLKLNIDDKLAFRMESDSLSYATTRQLNYIRDLELIRAFASEKKTDNDANIFYRIYVPPNAKQFFWNEFGPSSGIIPPVAPGTVRKITITAYDEYQNSAKLTLYIKSPDISPDKPSVVSVARQKDTLSVDCYSQNTIKRVVAEYRVAKDAPYKRLQGKLAQLDDIIDGRRHYRIKMAGGVGEYRFRTVESSGRTDDWIFLTDDRRTDKMRIFGTPDLLKMEYMSSSNAARVAVSVVNGERSFTLDMTPYGPRMFQVEIKGLRLAGPTSFTIKEIQAAVFDTQLVLYPVYPGSAAEIFSPDSTLKIEFQAGSAFYPAYVFPTSASRVSLKAGPGIVYDIQPDIFLVDQNIKFKFNVSKLNLGGKKVGVYGYSSTSDGWNFISKIQGTTLEAGGIGLGKLAIIEDSTPPVISAVTPSKSTKSRTPRLSCALSDNLSGLALDDGVSMSIDGNWVPAEYDIDSGKLGYSVKNPLKLGTHTLEIKASDNQGNISTKTVNFRVL